MDRRRVLSILLGLALAPAATAKAQDVQRMELREGGLVGRFYAMEGASRRTSLLMLTGSGGGYPSDAAARDLARAGHPVLAIAYFRDRAGLPPELDQQELRHVPLEYVFKALDWLAARPEVRADRIVVMGESRGAELALMIGSLRRDVAGVIAFSPSELRWGAVGGGGPAWTLDGTALPYAEGVFNRATPMSQFTNILDGPSEVRSAAVINVEHLNGPLLLISSRADAVWPSARMANNIDARLRAQGFSFPVENVQYEDASHLLMGFGPGMTEFRVSDQFTMRFGGTADGTERARDAGWARVKEFLGRL